MIYMICLVPRIDAAARNKTDMSTLSPTAGTKIMEIFFSSHSLDWLQRSVDWKMKDYE